MALNAFLQSDSDDDDEDINEDVDLSQTETADDEIDFLEENKVPKHNNIHDENDVNYLRIPWEGEPPKIILHKSESSNLKSPFAEDNDDGDNDSMKCVRKIWFCRDANDGKGRTLKVWDLPLTWDTNNIRTVFSIFGIVQSVALKNQNNIFDRHCLIRFKHFSKIDFAMNYDSNSIIQPLLTGNISLGINKYLTDYIKTRPLNIDKLQVEVDRFMNKFDKLQLEKKKKRQKMPRRHRGWIQKRDKDGFTKVHYPNKFERRKHRAIKITMDESEKFDNEKNAENDNLDGFGQPIGKGKTDKILKNDSFNAPPQPKVYDAKRKAAYYRAEGIKDVFKKKKNKMLKRQMMAKEKIKVQMRGDFKEESKMRMNGIAGARLRESMQRKQRWNKDMSQTTQFRKNRRFKPT